MKIGAQFYTVREFCKNTDDFAQTLARIADIGYTTVQISGTCAYDAAWLKEELDKNGLQCVLTHIPAQRLIEETEKVAKEHDVFGCKYVGLGSFAYKDGKTPQEFAETYRSVADSLRQNGKYFMYHNHAAEFRKIDGKPIFEHMAEMFPADSLGFTLDTYWIQTAGADPASWIEHFAGRVPCIHLKDHSYDRKVAPIGEGNINFDRVFAAGQKAGTEYMLVEQDDCNGEDPFDCLKRSYEFLRSRGFE